MPYTLNKLQYTLDEKTVPLEDNKKKSLILPNLYPNNICQIDFSLKFLLKF